MDTYEKKYKEALEKIKNLIDKDHNDINVDDVLNIFPELVESEDEKISKEIIYFLSGNTLQFGEDIDKYKSWIVWLEKQGNKLPVGFYYVNSEGKKFYSDTLKYGNVTLHVEKQGGIDNCPLEYSTNTVMTDSKKNQVKPKFKVGDWINGYYTNYKVLSVNNEGYAVEDVDGNKINILFENEKFHHLWTIQDAKDGDVLCLYYNNRKTFFIFKAIIGEGDYADILVHCCYTGKYQYLEPSFNGECRMHQISDGGYCLPADKEEQGILFQKMKEAGYEWDAEKKALKKIKPKPTWNEEDEEMLKSVIATCELAEQERDSSPAKHLLEMQLNWLKSLKQRIGG